MPNYEVMFACTLRDGSVVPYLRIIAVPNHSLAIAVGNAMRGELVAPGQWLDCLVYATPTSKQPHVPSALQNFRSIWHRVLPMVAISPNQVKWWYSDQIGLATNPQGHRIVEHTFPVIGRVAQCVSHYPEPEIVGFFFWPEE